MTKALDRIINSIRRDEVLCSSSHWTAPEIVQAIANELAAVFMCIDKLDSRVPELEGKMGK